jgi:hypothetical protein
MKHVGQILKDHIERNKLVKKQIAETVGITQNYLSTLFTKPTFDAELVEKLFVAVGLNPAVIFDVPEQLVKQFSDISAQTLLGNASVAIGSDEGLRVILAEKEKMIAEKERTIKILLEIIDTQKAGQNRDSSDK